MWQILDIERILNIQFYVHFSYLILSLVSSFTLGEHFIGTYLIILLRFASKFIQPIPWFESFGFICIVLKKIRPLCPPMYTAVRGLRKCGWPGSSLVIHSIKLRHLCECRLRCIFYRHDEHVALCAGGRQAHIRSCPSPCHCPDTAEHSSDHTCYTGGTICGSYMLL